MNLCDVSDEVGNGERVEGPQGQGLVCSMESDRYPCHVVNRWDEEWGIPEDKAIFFNLCGPVSFRRLRFKFTSLSISPFFSFLTQTFNSNFLNSSS